MGRDTTAGPADHSNVDELEILRHELGNVLHGMACVAGLLQASGLDARQRRWLKTIEQGCGQMDGIVERVLDARRGRPPGAARLNGVRLLEESLAAHAPAAAEKGIELLFVADPGLPPYWRSDACLLRQVLDNLLGNAIRYGATGRVLLEAAPAARDARSLLIRVLDSGPGVEDTARLFEPHRRGAAARQGPRGQGLGLFICRRIVESLGGRIGCRNRRVGGACFEVRIPGVLEPAARGLPPPRCLERLRCRLELDAERVRSFGALLDRLGVRWRRPGMALPAGPGGGLEVVIAHSPPPAGGCAPGVSIRVAGGAAAGRERRLAAPVLESTLEAALYRLLLEARAGAVSRRAGRG